MDDDSIVACTEHASRVLASRTVPPTTIISILLGRSCRATRPFESPPSPFFGAADTGDAGNKSAKSVLSTRISHLCKSWFLGEWRLSTGHHLAVFAAL